MFQVWKSWIDWKSMCRMNKLYSKVVTSITTVPSRMMMHYNDRSGGLPPLTRMVRHARLTQLMFFVEPAIHAKPNDRCKMLPGNEQKAQLHTKIFTILLQRWAYFRARSSHKIRRKKNKKKRRTTLTTMPLDILWRRRMAFLAVTKERRATKPRTILWSVTAAERMRWDRAISRKS